MPRPLRVALSPSMDEPHTLMPIDAEACLPLPLLESGLLRLWRSPRELVGGEALKTALEAASPRKKTVDDAAEDVEIGGAEGAQGREEWDDDLGEEVCVTLTPTTFDRKAKVVERHSHRYSRRV